MARVSLPRTLMLSLKIGRFCPRSLRMPKEQGKVEHEGALAALQESPFLLQCPPDPHSEL